MSLDCDDAMLLIASTRTLTAREGTQLGHHLEDCAECRALRVETAEEWRWVARMPQDAFEDPDLLVFPVVDPIVFKAGQVIASGGMGRITRVTDRRLGREVALKESLEGTLRSRFEREAAITARLQHPAIVPIYEAGSWPDGSLFYTMRLVDGTDLAAAIGKTTTFAERIALLPHVTRVTEALAYAHARKIIHRDLKPGNVLVGAYGETVVIDWGIAKELGRTIDDAKLPRLSSGDGLTRSGTILGTPCFMAPEQARGDTLDERADVYALGALLYNLLAGQPPYWDRFKNAELILEYSLLHPPTPIEELAPGVPADLRTIVERAMARAPADRYRDARAMAEELRRFETGQLIARDYTLRELAARWLAKHRTAVIVGAAALSILAVMAVIAVVNVRASRDAEAAARREAESNLETARVAAAATLEEQARSETLAGDRVKALTYASAAYAAGRDTPDLRYLLAISSRDAVRRLTEIGPPALETWCAPGGNCAGADVDALAYDRTGALVLVETVGRISHWTAGRLDRSFDLGQGVLAATLDPAVERAAIVHGPATFAMWDLSTGKRAWSITEPTLDGLRVDITFDPTGKYVVAVSDSDEQREVALRDAATGAVVAELVVGKREISAVAFSADGTRVAACDPNGAIKVWTIAGLQPIATWTGDPEPQSLAFLGNDRLAIDSSVAVGRVVSIWEVGRAPVLVKTLPPHRGPWVTLVPAPDGNSLVTSDDHFVRLFDRGGESVAEFKAPSRFDTLRFTPTGIVGHAIDSRLFVFERASLASRAILATHDSMIEHLTIDRASSRIATVGSSDQRVYEWTMPPGPTLLATSGRAAAWFGNRLAVADPAGITWFRADTGAADGRLAVALGDYPTLANAGDRLIAHGKTAQVIIEPDRSIRRIAEATVLEPSRDGRYALAADLDDDPPADGLRVWDLTAGKVALAVPLKVYTAAVIAGDTLVISANQRLTTYEIATGRKVVNRQLPRGHHYELALSPSGKALVAYSKKSILVLDPVTGDTRLEMTSPVDVDAITIARDDQLLLASTETGTWAWELPTARRLMQVDRKSGTYAVSPTGLLAIADGAQVRIVSRATGRQLDALDAVTSPIRTIAFDATGTRLAITTGSTVVMFDVRIETRDAATLEAIAKQLPWKIEAGVAVPR